MTRDAVAAARRAGLRVVAGLCLGETHGELELGPGPEPVDSVDEASRESFPASDAPARPEPSATG